MTHDERSHGGHRDGGVRPADAPAVEPLDCMETVRRLWDYLDGELGELDARAVDAHLAACEACASHYEFERGLLRALAAARLEHPAPSSLRERLRLALGREGYTGG